MFREPMWQLKYVLPRLPCNWDKIYGIVPRKGKVRISGKAFILPIWLLLLIFIFSSLCMECSYDVSRRSSHLTALRAHESRWRSTSIYWRIKTEGPCLYGYLSYCMSPGLHICKWLQVRWGWAEVNQAVWSQYRDLTVGLIFDTYIFEPVFQYLVPEMSCSTEIQSEMSLVPKGTTHDTSV